MTTELEKKTVHPEAKWVDTFVGVFQLEDTVHCLNVIDYAEQSPERMVKSGTFGGNQGGKPDIEVRDSQQVDYSPRHYPVCHKEILEFADGCLQTYMEKLPESANFPTFNILEVYNVIKYNKGQAYHGIHPDYMPLVEHLDRRHLSFVMFLNSVAEGGELEFINQDLRIVPEEGKAVIFPSGWTHSHRTLPPSETRYVLQLWWSFLRE